MSQKRTIDPAHLKMFKKVNRDVRACLIDPELIDRERARRILARYYAAIAPNFCAWMGATVVSVRSHQGRYAASENLYVEMEYDHQGLLYKFVDSADALPTVDDLKSVHRAVEEIRLCVSTMSGLKNLTIMTVLEGTSGEFIPWLAKLAEKCGGTDFEYTDTHGKADASHATQFRWAVSFEAEHHPEYSLAQWDIESSITLTQRFLYRLFNE